jgi:hypothetical protein
MFIHNKKIISIIHNKNYSTIKKLDKLLSKKPFDLQMDPFKIHLHVRLGENYLITRQASFDLWGFKPYFFIIPIRIGYEFAFP